MALKKKASLTRGLVLPAPDSDLRPLWRAFRKGATWRRIGGISQRRAIYTHERHGGRLRLEWWGKAIRFVIRTTDDGGMVHGAFVGHVVRHGQPFVERVVSLWPADSRDDKHGLRPNRLRFFLHGTAHNLATGETKKFNEPGELLTQLGKWNAEQARRVRSAKQ